MTNDPNPSQIRITKELNMTSIRKAVFPAAGLGTRFLPATKAQPKEMLPLVDKPIIQYAVEEAVNSGVENLIIVTGRGKNAIEDHFDVSFELERILEDRGKSDLLNLVRAVSDMVHIAYVRQKEALGLGHAILVTRELVGEQPFAVLLGDDIIEAEIPCVRQMIDVYERYHTSVVAIMEVPQDEVKRYGIIDAKPLAEGDNNIFDIRDMIEKPRVSDAPSNLAIIGRYILTPAIFTMLSETERGSGGEIQLTDGLRRLLAKERILGYRFSGKRYDAGEKLGFLTATVEFALKNKELGPAFRAYLKSLNLDTV
jgi:UTP--glucose-1-phosphate uridylyltransferase